MEDEKEKEETERIINSLPYKLPTYDKWHPIADFYHPLKCGSIDGTDITPHDHGIVRAMRAAYKPNRKVVGDPTKTLMVRHLSIETSEATVIELFSKYGEVEKCRLIRDIITGISRRYAFVEFKHKHNAEKVLEDENDIVIDGDVVTVDYELERTLPGWIPRRFGGGLGGKKESGQLRFGGCERPFRRPIPVDSMKLGRRATSQLDTGRNVNNKREHYNSDSRSRSNSYHSNSDKGFKRHCN